MDSYLGPTLVWVVLAKLTNTDDNVTSKCVGRGRNVMRNPSGSAFCSGSGGEDQQNFLHGKGPISCHKLLGAFVPGPPSQSIVSWAGESWSWPLWGVFQAPHITVFFFFFVHMNSTLHRTLGTVAHKLKDTAKQGLKCSQMVHFPPGSSVMLHDSFLHVFIYISCWRRKRVAVCLWGTIKVIKTTSKIGFRSGC